jgi:hypothetical protein
MPSPASAGRTTPTAPFAAYERTGDTTAATAHAKEIERRALGFSVESYLQTLTSWRPSQPV